MWQVVAGGQTSPTIHASLALRSAKTALSAAAATHPTLGLCSKEKTSRPHLVGEAELAAKAARLQGAGRKARSVGALDQRRSRPRPDPSGWTFGCLRHADGRVHLRSKPALPSPPAGMALKTRRSPPHPPTCCSVCAKAWYLRMSASDTERRAKRMLSSKCATVMQGTAAMGAV